MPTALARSWKPCWARLARTGSSATRSSGSTRCRAPERCTTNVINHHDMMTATIQPPALAFAWRAAVGDPALEPRIVEHHAAVSSQRDLEGDGLLWILQPDESGCDASPQFDPIWRHRAQGLPGFVELVHRNRARGFNIEAARTAGDPVVCESAHERHARTLAAGAGPVVDHAGPDRPALRRAPGGVPSDRRPANRGAHSTDMDGARPLALPDLPRASVIASSRSWSTHAASGRRSPRRPSRSTSRRFHCANTSMACDGTGAGRRGSTALG